MAAGRRAPAAAAPPPAGAATPKPGPKTVFAASPARAPAKHTSTATPSRLLRGLDLNAAKPAKPAGGQP